jgi:hypothetical protein
MTQYRVLASEGRQRYIYTKKPKKYIGKKKVIALSTVKERCRFHTKKRRRNKCIPLSRFAFKTIKKIISLHLLPFTASPLFLLNYCICNVCIVMTFKMNKSQSKTIQKSKTCKLYEESNKKKSLNTSLHLKFLSQNIAYTTV